MSTITTIAPEREGLLTPAQAAEYLGLSVGGLANRRMRGTSPRWVYVGRHVRYRLADLHAFIVDGDQEGGEAK